MPLPSRSAGRWLTPRTQKQRGRTTWDGSDWQTTWSAAVQQRVESRARRTVDLGCCCLFQPRPGGNLRGPHRTGQRIQGPGPKRSTLAPISLLTHTPLRGTPGRYGSPCWPLCWPSREQTDIVSKGLQGSKEERGDPQRGPSVTHGVTATQTPDWLRADTSPSMRQDGLPIARDHNQTYISFPTQERHRWFVSPSYSPGWGSRPLVFLARYLAGRPRGR